MADRPPGDVDWHSARRFLEIALRRQLHRDDPDLLQDLVQEAVVGLHRFVSSGKRARNLEALMTTIAQRTLVDQLRRERVRKALFVSDDGLASARTACPPAERTEADPVAMIEFLALEYFSSALPSSSPCLELARHYFEARNWEVVAAALGRKRDAIAKQWSRCVEGLRAAAREQGSALWAVGVDLREK